MPPLTRWRASRHEELPLDRLAGFPLLEACYRVWLDASGGAALPKRLDPLDLPREALPTVMLLDLEGQPAPGRLRVRLAGTEVCTKHGGELKGRATHDFFEAEDAAVVVGSALQVARSREPSLARRAYVSLNGRMWGYTRLIVPLSRGGEVVDSFFKVADPRTLGRLDD
ncbi:PAS domain-containing protein [Tistlia consotensis]|uniref:PAS domain-containing protein n=1 Tax=Tistlia consotensis USBA 355 TaxID=560819 RepID=A0A1Y6CGL3_9PROT|nr:PAS domain-containing protein [Tistlia consotensis]SMF62935.1 PAS domain-containing protein [Tistlia consotensis USBA 355]SNR95296.1 PAS domain-containing protein [Tistlia consotensis]